MKRGNVLQKNGILLVNLGTPDQPDIASVKRYLKQFLSDPRVIDLPLPLRWILVNAFILPFRSRSSSEAYRQIWTELGSPLLVNSQKFTKALGEKVGDAYTVALGMRYGNPSIPAAIEALRDCQHINVLPLFPQYASASTGSALEKVLDTFAKQWNVPSISIIHAFYDHPGFISAYANLIQRTLGHEKPDVFLFSYHGLPQRHIKKSGCEVMCDLKACPEISVVNENCYRAQCYQTSRLLANALALSESDYHVAFQSRLGRTPWIQPYTDQILITLAKAGVKHIAIACPSFVADCLETLEEIGLRTRAQWLALGGEKLTLIPCLNAQKDWVDAVAEMLRDS
ncbi:MAG: hemH [Gammaproteobacteria bacterium]|jgi:ferrochelatase|nr:hemH [Gammaproteobacteria bacterium]